MPNPEIQSENNFESKEQESFKSPENIESSVEIKNEINKEVEDTFLEFEKSDTEISKMESETDLMSSEEISDVKDDLKLDQQVEALDSEARMLKQETEQRLQWVILGEDHQFDEENYYRIVNEKGYADFLESGVVRSSPDGDESKTYGNIKLGGRPTSFPSFSKGSPDLKNYGKENIDNYILESDRQMYRRGDVNPVTGNIIRGRHYAHRPIDNETGEVINELKANAIKNIYKQDKLGNLHRQIKSESESI